jgi:hypothetical protein
MRDEAAIQCNRQTARCRCGEREERATDPRKRKSVVDQGTKREAGGGRSSTRCRFQSWSDDDWHEKTELQLVLFCLQGSQPDPRIRPQGFHDQSVLSVPQASQCVHGKHSKNREIAKPRCCISRPCAAFNWRWLSIPSAGVFRRRRALAMVPRCTDQLPSDGEAVGRTGPDVQCESRSGPTSKPATEVQSARTGFGRFLQRWDAGICCSLPDDHLHSRKASVASLARSQRRDSLLSPQHLVSRGALCVLVFSVKITLLCDWVATTHCLQGCEILQQVFKCPLSHTVRSVTSPSGSSVISRHMIFRESNLEAAPPCSAGTGF